jgi:hypothetical protein
MPGIMREDKVGRVYLSLVEHTRFENEGDLNEAERCFAVMLDNDKNEEAIVDGKFFKTREEAESRYEKTLVVLEFIFGKPKK